MSRSLLLADDTEISRWYLGESLRAAGLEVTLAVDGASALAQASARCFDLLVLDQRMPGLFGDEVLARVRADPRAASQASPALAISSELEAADVARLLLAGFAAVLAKPLQASQLLQVCQQLDRAGAVPAALAAAEPAMSAPELPHLDDRQALQALGSALLVPKLRAMLRAELLLRRVELGADLARQDAGALRDRVHQLLASCAMCGAPRLAVLLRACATEAQAGRWLPAQLAGRAVFDEIGLLLQQLPAAQP